jgi:hypothetical protein
MASREIAMPVKSWRSAVSAIDKAIGPINSKQGKLATLAGISMPASMPSIVAAARLRLALSGDLYLVNSSRARFDTLEYIDELWRGPRRHYVPPATQDEANAWVEYLYLLRRRSSLVKLRPTEGDVVATPDGAYAEVSSIGENGRLYFKGGGGFGAWPDCVVAVARAREKSIAATTARTKARNAASKPSGSWSMARHEDLDEFQVTVGVTPHDIEQLAAVIDTAVDERPLQKHLEIHPQILAMLLQRTPRYVIPQKRLGNQFVLDFVVGDVDSMGIHWFLVELESPKASVYLTDAKTLSAQARKGMNQVVEWRNWLHNNIAYARQSRREDGLGLFDIRSDARALVLVGRRSSLIATTDAARREARASLNVHVHTYDWLLETVRGASEFFGPSAANSYTLERDFL